jgi:hypothetical protein
MISDQEASHGVMVREVADANPMLAPDTAP